MMFFSRERCRTIWLRGVPWQHTACVMSSVMQVSGRAYMSQRSAGEWIDWIEGSRVFSTQPYTQLAATLLPAGRRSTAEAIQLAGRERERAESPAHRNFGAWAWLTILSYVAGYGIGLYTFRVLWWVLSSRLLGSCSSAFRPMRAHTASFGGSAQVCTDCCQLLN
jgi:hypothetical protein